MPIYPLDVEIVPVPVNVPVLLTIWLSTAVGPPEPPFSKTGFTQAPVLVKEDILLKIPNEATTKSLALVVVMLFVVMLGPTPLR
jgi:hypothetical protein